MGGARASEIRLSGIGEACARAFASYLTGTRLSVDGGNDAAAGPYP
jgi:hypothetical protein